MELVKQHFLTIKNCFLEYQGEVMMSYHLPEKPTNVDRLPKKDSASFQNENGKRLPCSPTIFVPRDIR